MPHKKISLRWKAAQKYQGKKTDGVESKRIRFYAWEFLQAVTLGDITLDPPFGSPTTCKITFPDHARLTFVIGRPEATDPDHDADFYVEDFWASGDAEWN